MESLETHNPDSQCATCCSKVDEIHSALMPLIAKLSEIANSFDKDKFDGLLNSPMVKILTKFGG